MLYKYGKRARDVLFFKKVYFSLVFCTLGALFFSLALVAVGNEIIIANTARPASATCICFVVLLVHWIGYSDYFWIWFCDPQ